jgi:hypothetical protein
LVIYEINGRKSGLVSPPPPPIILIIPELSLKVSSLCKKNSVTNFMNSIRLPNAIQ